MQILIYLTRHRYVVLRSSSHRAKTMMLLTTNFFVLGCI